MSVPAKRIDVFKIRPEYFRKDFDISKLHIESIDSLPKKYEGYLTPIGKKMRTYAIDYASDKSKNLLHNERTRERLTHRLINKITPEDFVSTSEYINSPVKHVNTYKDWLRIEPRKLSENGKRKRNAVIHFTSKVKTQMPDASEADKEREIANQLANWDIGAANYEYKFRTITNELKDKLPDIDTSIIDMDKRLHRLPRHNTFDVKINMTITNYFMNITPRQNDVREFGHKPGQFVLNYLDGTFDKGYFYTSDETIPYITSKAFMSILPKLKNKLLSGLLISAKHFNTRHELQEVDHETYEFMAYQLVRDNLRNTQGKELETMRESKGAYESMNFFKITSFSIVESPKEPEIAQANIQTRRKLAAFTNQENEHKIICRYINNTENINEIGLYGENKCMLLVAIQQIFNRIEYEVSESSRTPHRAIVEMLSGTIKETTEICKYSLRTSSWKRIPAPKAMRFALDLVFSDSMYELYMKKGYDKCGYTLDNLKNILAYYGMPGKVINADGAIQWEFEKGDIEPVKSCRGLEFCAIAYGDHLHNVDNRLLKDIYIPKYNLTELDVEDPKNQISYYVHDEKKESVVPVFMEINSIIDMLHTYEENAKNKLFNRLVKLGQYKHLEDKNKLLLDEILELTSVQDVESSVAESRTSWISAVADIILSKYEIIAKNEDDIEAIKAGQTKREEFIDIPSAIIVPIKNTSEDMNLLLQVLLERKYMPRVKSNEFGKIQTIIIQLDKQLINISRNELTSGELDLIVKDDDVVKGINAIKHKIMNIHTRSSYSNTTRKFHVEGRKHIKQVLTSTSAIPHAPIPMKLYEIDIVKAHSTAARAITHIPVFDTLDPYIYDDLQPSEPGFSIGLISNYARYSVNIYTAPFKHKTNDLFINNWATDNDKPTPDAMYGYLLIKLIQLGYNIEIISFKAPYAVIPVDLDADISKYLKDGCITSKKNALNALIGKTGSHQVVTQTTTFWPTIEEAHDTPYEHVIGDYEDTKGTIYYTRTTTYVQIYKDGFLPFYNLIIDNTKSNLLDLFIATALIRDSADADFNMCAKSAIADFRMCYANTDSIVVDKPIDIELIKPKLKFDIKIKETIRNDNVVNRDEKKAYYSLINKRMPQFESTIEPNRIMIDDEYDGEEIYQKIKDLHCVAILGAIAGAGKTSVVLDNYDPSDTLIVCGQNQNCMSIINNPLTKNKRANSANAEIGESRFSARFKAVTLHEFFLMDIMGNKRAGYKTNSIAAKISCGKLPYKNVLFDEAYMHCVPFICEIQAYVKECKNIHFIINGDKFQLLPVGQDLCREYNSLYDELICLNIASGNFVKLEKSKRTNDNLISALAKYLINNTSPKSEIISTLKNEFNIKTITLDKHNLANNELAKQAIHLTYYAELTRDVINAQFSAEVNDDLVCERPNKKLGLKKNLIYQKVDDCTVSFSAYDPEINDNVVTKISDPEIMSYFRITKARTVHGAQGQTISKPILIHDIWSKHVDWRWLYVCITRTTNLENVYFVESLRDPGLPGSALMQPELDQSDFENCY